MRDDAVDAEAALLVFLVIGEIALEPFDVAVAFEGQHVRGDAVEEEAVVADDDGAAGEIEQGLLERAQRVDVEVVGRLVEQEQVRAALQHFGEMHAVALAAGELADLLLLVRALEVESPHIGAAVHLALAERDDVVAAGDFLPNIPFAVERVARLIDIAKLDTLADLDRARVWLFLTGDHAEERRLAGAVGADHADDPAGRQLEREFVDEHPIAIAFAKIDDVDDVLAQPLGHGNDNLRAGWRLLVALPDKLVIGSDTRLRLGLTRSLR